jgi:Ca2+-binding RTX toxin-like protein
MANLTINLVDNAKGDLGTFISEYNIYDFSIDFNGDGNPDLITQADNNGKYSVFFANNTDWQYPLDSSQLNGKNGFTIDGTIYDTYTDWNGDGISDLVIQDNNGKYSIFFGNNTGWQYPLNSSQLNGKNGFAIDTVSGLKLSNDFYNYYVDFNRDYIPDALLEDGKKMYFLFGKKGSWEPQINLSNIGNLDNSLVINPENGSSVTLFDNDYYKYNYNYIYCLDFDADNTDDFVFKNTDNNKYYVVFGKSLEGKSQINLSDLNGENGFIIQAETSNDLNFYGVYKDTYKPTESQYVDFNNDQIYDLILQDNGNEKTYVVFGKSSGWGSKIDLSNLNGNNGFVIDNSQYSGIGDFNGDGKNDLIVSNPLTATEIKYYVILNQGKWNPEINLTDINISKGFVISEGSNGFSLDLESGASFNGLESFNDINGDSKDDLIFRDDYSANYYVLFGKGKVDKSLIDLSNLNGKDGLQIIDPFFDQTLSPIEINLDINNDGNQDLFFNEYFGDKVYVLFGKSTEYPNPIDLSKLDGSDGFIITNYGPQSITSTLYNTSLRTKDINNDNINDLIISDKYDYKDYVLLGKSTAWQSTINISEIPHNNDSYFINKPENSDLETEISYDYYTDINGDGYYDNIFSDKGKLYIVLTQGSDLQLPINLSSLNGENGFIINTLTNQRPVPSFDYYYIGNSYSYAYDDLNFDWNSDGKKDISFRGDGKQYILLSQATGWQPEINVSDLNGNNGFAITNGKEKVPNTLSSFVDVNGDGNKEVGIFDVENPEKVYVVFSQKTGWQAEIDISQLNGQNGFVIKTQRFIQIISSDQDINGDEINDLLLDDSQNAYVIFGQSDGWDAEIDLANLNDKGFIINIIPDVGSIEIDDDFFIDDSYSISTQKINNDNIADLLINYSNWSYTTEMESGTYILFGSPDITKNGSLSTSTNYTLQAKEENLTLTGTENIRAVGNSLPNEIQGNSGDNVIKGMQGNDNLSGGNGNDNVQGGEGDDILSDVLKPPTIPSTRTTDNTVENNDRLIGGDGQDLLKAGYANDSLYGQDDDDTLHGQLDHDKLLGGASNDVLLGGQGRDQINGNVGNDILTGGASKDKFVFNTNSPFTKASLGIDEITDFQLEMDKIVLDRKTFTELSTTSNNILKSGEFAEVTNINQAEISQAIIVYNSTNGALYYNPNGIDLGFDTGGQFAILTNTPNLNNTDILIRN